MTVVNGVPANLTTRWNINTSRGSSPLPTPSSVRKFNTSCNGCRKSRVKCSGGHPCQRCVASLDPYACIYSVSQRRGKHKATNALSPGQHTTPVRDSEIVASLTFGKPDDWVEPQSLIWDSLDMSMDETGQVDLDQTLFPDSLNFQMRDSPSLTEFLDSLEQPSPPSTNVTDRGKCAESCFIPIHKMTNELMTAGVDAVEISLEKALSMFDKSIAYACKYLACPNCDPGCPRIMNLAFLHQRQVNLLSNIAKDPATFLNEKSAQVTLGEYRTSREDDATLKRVLLLRVARDVLQSVNECHERSKEFEDRFKEGTLELGDIGKLNLQWLLGIASNLTKRLNCIKSLLEKNDWPLDTDKQQQ